MMNPVMGRGIENPFKRSQFTNDLSMSNYSPQGTYYSSYSKRHKMCSTSCSWIPVMTTVSNRKCVRCRAVGSQASAMPHQRSTPSLRLRFLVLDTLCSASWSNLHFHGFRCVAFSRKLSKLGCFQASRNLIARNLPISWFKMNCGMLNFAGCLTTCRFENCSRSV